MLVGTDVTLPKTFEMVPPSRENGMHMRMAGREYHDESGTRYVSASVAVECSSHEQQVLRCSFGDTML